MICNGLLVEQEGGEGQAYHACGQIYGRAAKVADALGGFHALVFIAFIA
jgi:hypothetical protein